MRWFSSLLISTTSSYW